MNFMADEMNSLEGNDNKYNLLKQKEKLSQIYLFLFGCSFSGGGPREVSEVLGSFDL